MLQGYDDYYQGGAGGGGGYGGGYGGGGGNDYAPPGPQGYGPPMGGPGPRESQYGRPPPGMSEDAWAQQGYPVHGPNGWVMYRAKDTGEAYYHNYNSNATQWEKPADWPPNM